jgi:NADH:ubiquinone oxidoreductase subunit 5 (subunit L)/multisubunit Na+/H+ antiporter MnhA subunit
MIWAPVLIPALAGLVIWAVGGGRVRLGVLGTGAALLTLAATWAAGGATGGFDWAGTLSLTVALPPMAQAVAVTTGAVTVAVMIFAASHEEEAGLARLIGLLLVFTGGMELVVIASDLLTLLIGWEIVGACSWALIAHHWRAEAPGRSATYAFVMTRTGDLGLFLALFVTYAATGGTGYADLAALDGGPLTLAAAGILVAAVSKAGQLPFAPWLFRAMDGPTSVSAHLHSATMVAAGAYLLARLHPQLAPAAGFAPPAMAVGLVTAILAGVAAVRQMHAKKVLAGSTSSHMGLMIAAVGAGFPGVAILHLVVHAAMKAALFFVAGIAKHAAGTFDLREMRLGRTLPIVAALAAIAALSLAAVPPLSGGWSKEEVMKALEHAGLLSAAAGILAGGISAAYATRFAVMAFWPDAPRGETSGRGEIAALALVVAAVVGLSALWFPPVHDAAAQALGATLPEGSTAGLVAAQVAVALGVVTGLYLARNPGETPEADWFGLPGLIDAAVTRPALAVSMWASRVDDGWVDKVVTRSATGLAGRATGADTGWIDLIPRGSAGLARRMAGGAQRSDARGLPAMLSDGSARMVGHAGADAGRAQTGLSHHYYVILVAGLALAVLFLIFGA